MRETCGFLAPLLFAWAASLHAQEVRPDSDDRSKLAALFASAVNNGGKVRTIAPAAGCANATSRGNVGAECRTGEHHN